MNGYLRFGCLLLGGVILVLGGCAAPAKKAPKPQRALPPAEPLMAAPLPPAPPPQEGSLWTARGQYHGLVADHRALNVGDLITISITEKAQASEAAQTKTSKTSGVKAGIASLFGLSFPMKTFTDKMVNADTALEGQVGNNSSGEGKTERQSAFTTYLTVVVVQVLPNGNLMIRGQRHMRVNNETEIVTLTGLVRPEDIDRSNTVPSTRVAQARVEISGKGVVSDKQRQGWLTRIFDHIWPW